MPGPPSSTDLDGGSVLALNAGSSSLKFALFGGTNALPVLMRGEVSELETSPHLIAHDGTGRLIAEQSWPAGEEKTFADALGVVFALIDAVSGTGPGQGPLRAVGHRIVHGGEDHVAPERLTSQVIAALEALIPLDPIHLPRNLGAITAVAEARPGILQIGCFDTAFHQTVPLVARSFALPRALQNAGVRRYGFHGLSYEYIARRLARELPDLAQRRIIVAHLGAGASLCALSEGTSIANTFGISVLDGLMMATRCGSLDPGVIFYLARLGHSLAEIEDMLYHRSGLLGVSGISGDMRLLLESEKPPAREAIDLYTYRIALEIGAMTSALGGLDGIVFTAGIGQHSPQVRAAVCARLDWLGVKLDASANAADSFCISSAQSAVDVRVMATDEETMIAQHVFEMVKPPHFDFRPEKPSGQTSIIPQ